MSIKLNFLSKLVYVYPDWYILRKAYKKFTTPVRRSLKERELQFCKSAKEELVFIDAIAKDVMVYSYGYSKKRVLLVHGWSGNGAQFYKIADRLLEKGMMVISFDAPAHGKSNGKKTKMSDFTAIIEALLKKENGFFAAIGHSLGAMVLLQAVAKGFAINKLVSIGGTNDINEILKNVFNTFGIYNKRLILKFKKYFKQKNEIDLDDFKGIALAKRIDIPTLIIHDTFDQLSDVSNAYEIRQNLKKGVLLITSEKGHTKILKDNNVIDRIVNFLQ